MADQKAPDRFGFERLQYAVVIGGVQLRLEERIVKIGTPSAGFVRWIGIGEVDEKVGQFGNIKGPAPFLLPGAETFEDAMNMALAAFNQVKAEAVKQATRAALSGAGQPPLPGVIPG